LPPVNNVLFTPTCFHSVVHQMSSLHCKFFRYHLSSLPLPYSSQDANIIMLIYFSVAGMRMTEQDGQAVTSDQARKILSHLQTFFVESVDGEGGAAGSVYSQLLRQGDSPSTWDVSHVTMSQCTLLLIAMLHPLLPNTDTDCTHTTPAQCCATFLGEQALARWSASLRRLQQSSGVCAPTRLDTEGDMRFVYSAVVTHVLTGSRHNGLDVESTVGYILRSQDYSGGFAQGPGLEAHGGSTFCAIASLSLLGRLGDLSPRRRRLVVNWLADRFSSNSTGVQGRANKPSDTCYSFWCGGALRILGEYDALVDPERVLSFTQDCQGPTGGFGKVPDAYADLLHSYMGLLGVSLAGEKTLQKVNAELAIPSRLQTL